MYIVNIQGLFWSLERWLHAHQQWSARPLVPVCLPHWHWSHLSAPAASTSKLSTLSHLRWRSPPAELDKFEPPSSGYRKLGQTELISTFAACREFHQEYSQNQQNEKVCSYIKNKSVYMILYIHKQACIYHIYIHVYIYIYISTDRSIVNHTYAHIQTHVLGWAVK